MPSGRFSKGDRVELIKTFNCVGDGDKELDERIDRELREAFDGQPVVGTVIQGRKSTESTDYLQVAFDKSGAHGPDLYVDEDVLDHENVVTEKDVMEAILSIQSTFRARRLDQDEL